MAFVVSDLTSFVERNRDVFIKKAVLGSPSIERATKQTGIKGSEYLNVLETSPALQSAASCGWNASGNATFTERTIVTAPIKVNMEFCGRTLIGKATDYEVQYGENPEIPFKAKVMDDIMSKVNQKMEKGVWQGDITSEDAELKLFDGWIKNIESASGSYIAVSISSGKSAYEAIKAVYMAIPEDALELGAKINASPELFRAFLQELVDRNYYHYTAGEGVEEIIFPGSSTPVVKVGGLKGTKKIVATFDENLVYGCDLLDDKEDVAFENDKFADLAKFKAVWNSGCQVVFPDLCVVGTMAANPVSPDSQAEALSSIASDVATIATKTGTIATKSGNIADAVDTLAGAVNEDGQIETHPNEDAAAGADA